MIGDIKQKLFHKSNDKKFPLPSKKEDHLEFKEPSEQVDIKGEQSIAPARSSKVKDKLLKAVQTVSGAVVGALMIGGPAYILTLLLNPSPEISAYMIGGGTGFGTCLGLLKPLKPDLG